MMKKQESDDDKKKTVECPCYEYDERVAIMQYDGGVKEANAKYLVRHIQCVGCKCRLGLNVEDLSNGK